MSPAHSLDDDEYVAKLLAEDAKKSSIRYSTLGLSALLPKRPTYAAPKPNTRFLNSIIRDADSHNAALKKKEELEARMRLRKIRERADEDGRWHSTDGAAPPKRRRLSDDDQLARSDRHYTRDKGPARSRTQKTGRLARSARDRTPHSSSGDNESVDARGRREHYQHSRRHSRSHGRDAGVASRKHEHRSSHAQHRTRDRRRSNSPDFDPEATKQYDDEGRTTRTQSHRDPRAHSGSSEQCSRRRTTHPGGEIETATPRRVGSRSLSSDSDPLEIIVGPLPAADKGAVEPPLVSRGRGAYRTATSAMDAHFSAKYDPKLDLHPEAEADEEKEDWDMALEALRDREMWKRKHAERLREAGFDDDEIKKWENSGKEQDIDNVRWRSKGEAREWDLGKVSGG